MMEKINEQMQTAMKPWTEMNSLGLSTMQAIAEKQSALYTSMMNDSIAVVEKYSQQKDLMGIIEVQKEYLDGLQKTVTESVNAYYSTITEAQQKMGEILKEVGAEYTAKMQNIAK